MKLDTNSVLGQIMVRGGTEVALPKEFHRLHDLAHNMWWSWHPDAHKLWSQIDPRRWLENRNPLSLLQGVDTETWEALAQDGSFGDLYDEVMERFDDYMAGGDTWYQRNYAGKLDGPVAYLCAEFGVHHTLPFYSGGLGVLAGDHTKAASDLGLPFIGIGLLYRRGFFRQAIDPDGNQQHHYTPLEMVRRPFREVLNSHRHPLRVKVDFPDRQVTVRAWQLDVGRVPLLMLDTFLAENDPADRPICNILYVRGRQMRLCQELILGIAGARVLDELGIEPAVWHVNEGHAAFSLLERLSRSVQAGNDFDDARKDVQRNTLFTLHTPIPAGNEVFPLDMVERYVDGHLPGVAEDMLPEFGRARQDDKDRFDLGALAIRLSSFTNGVSRRHGEVVTGDWQHLIGGPAAHITNGVHIPTWLGTTLHRLYAEALGSHWPDRLHDPDAWQAILDLPDKQVWQAHTAQKERLLRRLRDRLLEQFARHGAGPDRLRQIDDQLPPHRLTIVFSRRFATYKRAGLLFTDLGRLQALFTNPERPVQLIFAGKAHPADRDGQGLIRWVAELSRSPELAGHIYFVEDYDMQLARWLVGGADVWLNTPRPPMEASGTSGMKAAANGVLNVSVLDGWWPEAYNGNNGWAFGEVARSDHEDANTLYELFEQQVVPMFYDRNDDGIPVEWVARMKDAMANITPAFSTHRMVAEYATEAYLPLGATAD